MAIDVQIMPDRGLVVVSYTGTMTVGEGMEAFHDFVAQGHAARTPLHLIDLSRITSFVHPFPGMLTFNADMVSAFLPNAGQTYMAFVAPHEEAMRAADFSARAWGKTFDRVVVRVFDDEAAALSFLGMSEARIAEVVNPRTA